MRLLVLGLSALTPEQPSGGKLTVSWGEYPGIPVESPVADQAREDPQPTRKETRYVYQKPDREAATVRIASMAWSPRTMPKTRRSIDSLRPVTLTSKSPFEVVVRIITGSVSTTGPSTATRAPT